MTATAAIVTIGDELMLGDRLDTNGPWLSSQLLKKGIQTIERRSVHDDVEAIAQAIKELALANDLCILTGGLGPTEDDRTRLALAMALGESLEHDKEAHASITAWFSDRGVTMPKQNDSQALRPISANWIENRLGTAPGLLANIDGCQIYCLPGPPSELQMMFIQMKEEMFAVLECGVSRQTIELHAWGMPESIAGEKIADLMQLETPNVAILMGSAGITARITGEDEQANDSIADEIIKRWSPWFYGRGNETIAYAIGEALQGTIATAESCTAGLVSDLLAKTSGASAWFQGGWITYSNAMKVNQLGVDQRLLDEFGAVSWQVAKAMSQGATKHSGATVGVSTTGVAGPSGGSEEKPVGTVFIGCTFFGDTQVREFRFTGTRNEIRHRAASTALQMVRLLMCGECPESMCWQLGETIA